MPQPKRTRIQIFATAEADVGALEDKWFEVLRVGEYNDPRYDTFSVTPELLQDLKKNFDENILGIDIALDCNHDSYAGAWAWIKGLKIKGDSLYAQYKDFTDECRAAMLEKKYRYFSVEFSPFTKPEGGKDVTYRNVLRGIALTNRPVIKGMQPAFSEGAGDPVVYSLVRPNRTRHMNAVKVFAQTLLTRGKVSQVELADFKVMVAALSEEEKADVAEDADKVEAEAVKTTEAETKAAEEAKAKAEAEAAAAAPAAPAAVAAAEGDVATQLAETNKKLEAVTIELAEKQLATDVSALILSESNLTGFGAADKEKVAAFVKGLSKDQRAAFSEIVKVVKTVDKAKLAEIGAAAPGTAAEPKDMEAKLAEANAKAKERATKTGEPLHIALAETIKEMGLHTEEVK